MPAIINRSGATPTRSAVVGLLVLTLVPLAAAAAESSYGAIAYDQTTGKYGASFNQPEPWQANEQALRQCHSAACRVHPVEPLGCGALAMSDKDRSWAGADRGSLADAERDAVLHCQARAQGGTCKVRVSGCNK